MRIVFLKGAVDLLKATSLQEITVPAYTRRDGTFVPQHRKMVRVSTDRSRDDVLAGRGSAAQREAHARLHRVIPGFSSLPDDHREAHILSHAHGIQNARNQARDLSGWRQAARGGQNPTSGQWAAFYRLGNDERAAELAQIGDTSHLRAPANAVAGSAAPATPAAAPATPVAATAPSSGGADDGVYRLPGDDVNAYRRLPNGSWEVSVAGSSRPNWMPVRNMSVAEQLNRQRRLSNSPADSGAAPASVPAPASASSDYASEEQAHLAKWEAIATDDYQRRDGQYPRSGVPDAIESGAFQGAPWASFRFKNTSPDVAQRWVESFLRQKGLRHTRINARQDGDYADDWVEIGVRGEVYVAPSQPPSQPPAPPASVAAASEPDQPRGIRVNGMTLDRRPDGSWISREGTVHGAGNAIAIAADVLAGVDVPSDEIHAYTEGARLGAVQALVRLGKQPETMLDKLFPDSTNPASGRREGETKSLNGHTYVLRGGRWHRQDQDQGAAASAAPASPETPSPTAQARSEDLPGSSFVNRNPGHDKFWTARVDGNRLIVHYGRNGSRGMVNVTEFNSSDEALAAFISKRNEKVAGGYRAQDGLANIPGALIDAAVARSRPVPSSVAAVVAQNAAPAAAQMPAHEEIAVRRAMDLVPFPTGVSSWSNSATNQQARRRLTQLEALAHAGDLDGVTNFSTTRSRSNYALVDDYRTALLAAAHQARESLSAASTPAPVPSAEIPVPPEITGANPSNTALLSAQRKVAALYAAARSADPVAAILAIPTSRGNGYVNRADDYKSALLTHFGYSHDGAATREGAHTPVRDVAPAVTSVTVGSPGRPVRRPASTPAVGTGPVELDASIAANPDRKTVTQLGFVPRPNVPTSWTVRRDGVHHPDLGLLPWPNERMAELARNYLSQPGQKQSVAKDYQRSVATRLAPLHPDFQAVEARRGEILAQRRAAEEAEARRAAAAEEERRRAAIKQTRVASANFLDKLAALPDLHKPVNRVGGNISSYSGDMVEAGLKLGLNDASMKEIVGRLVADYGNNVTFTSSVRVSGHNVIVDYSGSDGTRITREFKKGSNGKYFVYHSYFKAGRRGQGSGKSLFRTSLGAYKALGITRVDVYANIDVGGYAWAKFGFKCDQSEWDNLRRLFLRRVDGLGLTGEANVRLKKILNDTDPKAMFLLSDFKHGERNIGKEFLLGLSWHGSLHLDDEVMYRRCVGYISQGRN